MATLAEPSPHIAAPVPTHWEEGNPSPADLAHIPGEGGLPVIGNTFRMLADPHAFTKAMVAKYGPVYKNRAFGGWVVALVDNHVTNYSDLCVFDAQHVDEGPIARAKLPIRIRQGLHGNFATAAQMGA